MILSARIMEFARVRNKLLFSNQKMHVSSSAAFYRIFMGPVMHRDMISRSRSL